MAKCNQLTPHLAFKGLIVNKFKETIIINLHHVVAAAAAV